MFVLRSELLVEVYLSPAKELDPLTILPLPQQTVGPFACEAGASSTKLFSLFFVVRSRYIEIHITV